MPGKRQNRPQSKDIVDLHVFLVPLELWIGKYRTAFNNAVLQATSAGFIRVPSDYTLRRTRDEIIDQLEPEGLPVDFVFLRSVGRCLAAVNQNQEEKLKAKHFLPPIAFSPELFLLPCSHTDLSSILARESRDVYIRGQIVPDAGSLDLPNYDNYLTSSDGDNSTESRETTSDLKTKESSLAKSGEIPQDNLFDNTLIGNQNNEAEFPPNSNGEDRDALETDEAMGSLGSAIDQSEMLHHVPRPSKKTSTMSEKLRDFSLAGRSQSTLPAIQVIQAELQPTTAQNGNRVGIPTPLPSGKVITPKADHSRKSVKQQNIASNVKSVEKGDTLTFNDEENSQEQSTEVRDGNENSHDRNRNDIIDFMNENQDDSFQDELIFDPDNYDREDSCSSNAPNLEHQSNDVAKEQNHKETNESERSENSPEERNGNLQDFEGEDSNTEDLFLISPRDRSKSNRERQRKIDLEKKRLEEKKRNAAEGANKMMQEMDDLLKKKKAEEEKRKKQEEEVRKMMKAAEEEKKREIERLKEEVRLAKEEKAEVQKRREAIVKLAKELQAKIQAKTNKDTNMWKKKYQYEVERTTELEEELNRLRTELDIQHKKLLGTFDVKAHQTTQKASKIPKAKAPSQLSNQKIQLRRLQQEVQLLRDRVEETRVKLSAERKMRAIAFQELKELRNQALEKKINAALSSRRFPSVRPVDGHITA